MCLHAGRERSGTSSTVWESSGSGCWRARAMQSPGGSSPATSGTPHPTLSTPDPCCRLAQKLDRPVIMWKHHSRVLHESNHHAHKDHQQCSRYSPRHILPYTLACQPLVSGPLNGLHACHGVQMPVKHFRCTVLARLRLPRVFLYKQNLSLCCPYTALQV